MYTNKMQTTNTNNHGLHNNNIQTYSNIYGYNLRKFHNKRIKTQVRMAQ